MCGIAGFLSFNGRFDVDQLGKMTSCLAHRGPDASGLFFDGICGLGHRRLSVIDLTENANQPMVSSDERFVISYNGEVYNYQEIGAHLLELGLKSEFRFKTASDTEVVLESFIRFGIDFIKELNGMFAIAIYDQKENELYLFRDRLGIKPLFYYWDGQHFAFASEIKALRTIGNLDFELNNLAIGDFLHLGFIPAPHTIYKNIYKLQPGSYIRFSRNGLTKLKYWNLRQKITHDCIAEKEEALIKLSDLLTSSVQYQLKSDVPFGVFLSGGIDSSLVTAQAVNLCGKKINTFSIGFEENKFNESEYAKAVANYLGTNHHEFIVSYKDAISLIDESLAAYDEPNSDSSMIPTMLVSRLARDFVKVTLSGEGGDELFFGYGAYKWANRLANPIKRCAFLPWSYLFAKLPSRYKRISRLLRTAESRNLQSHIFSQEQYLFSDNELGNLFERDFLKSLDEENEQSGFLTHLYGSGPNEFLTESLPRRLCAMEKQAIFDLENYLPDDLLTKVDRASMYFSLETRVPYLDHRLVEFALNVSPGLKYQKFTSKYILKEVLYKYVPKELFDRPKQGFSIPLNKWLLNELYYLIEENLNESVVKKYGIVEFSRVQSLISSYLNGNNFLYNRIWALIVLHRWMQRNC